MLKSLSATSKLLSESISERVQVKTKDARQKIDRLHNASRTKINETTKTASLKLKNVRKSLYKIGDNFSLGRLDKKDADSSTMHGSKCGEYDLDRPQTLPANDEIFQSISFNSPMNAKSNNCEQLNIAESSYEIPKKVRSCSTSDFYSEEKLTATGSDCSSMISLNVVDTEFARNTSLTQSMFSNVETVKGKSPVPVARTKIKSETDLSTAAAQNKSDSPSLSSSTESIPCPSFPPPPPIQDVDHIYGKIIPAVYSSSTDSDQSPRRPPVRHKRRKDYETTEIRPKLTVSNAALESVSNRATVDSNEYTTVENRFPKIFSRDISSTECSEQIQLEEKSISMGSRSESWNFYDANADCDDAGARSSPEPIYANDIVATPPTEIITEPVYGMICNMESPDNTLLTPQDVARKRRSQKSDVPIAKADCSSSDILKEFDPLVMSTVDQIFSDKSNELILLENLLGEETYGHVSGEDKTNNVDLNSTDLSDDEESTDEDVAVPAIPARQDSLVGMASGTSSIAAVSLKKVENVAHKSVIIHQNMKLRSDSLENMLAEDEAVAPFLARVDDKPQPPSLFNDLNRPPPPPPSSNSNWFVDDDVSSSCSGTKAMAKKPKSERLNVTCDPPSYSEAMGELVTEEKPILTSTKSSMKSMLSNVLTKMEGINLGIKRKTSFKSLSTSGITKSTGDVKVIVEMVPRPPLTQSFTLHEGHLVRFPSGVVDDILKEQQFRKAYLRDRKFQTYFDKDPKTVKENIPLECITTIQRVSQQKFTGNNSMEMHCFEITTAIPKSSGGNMSNPNMKMSSSGDVSASFKSQRVCHLYGVPKESDRFVWMQKLLESLTDVFPTAMACKYYRAGWCYLKNSISSQWSGAWILLQKQKRKLLCYSTAEMNLECLDLRKARCLVLKESDDSIRNLHVESGPILMIDCPPYSMYMIMGSPRETKVIIYIF